MHSPLEELAAELAAEGKALPTGVPRARVEFEELASEIEAYTDKEDVVLANMWLFKDWAAAIRKIVAENLHRRPPARPVVRGQSRKMTPQLRRSIASYLEQNPEMSYLEVAKVFNVSTARVSEIKAGKRE